MITISEEITRNYQAAKTDSISDLAALITKHNWSCGTFKDGYRNLSNFEGASTIALDFDSGLSLMEARAKFLPYKHIIATTRSHQKDKGKEGVQDRFRVLLFLEEPIKNASDYTATWESLREQFPQCDKQCKDASRFYYPSKKVVQIHESGISVKVKKWVATTPAASEPLAVINRGRLSRLTMEFIVAGAPPGEWNARLTKAAIDLHEQGYQKEEAVAILSKASGILDTGDHRCIDSVYTKEPRYNKRGNSFNFKTPSQVQTDSDAIEWSVEGLLYKGSLSILSGPPKSGKSVLARNMIKSFLTGADFLNRAVLSPGPALYVALEDHGAMISEDFKALGIFNSKQLLVHNEPLPSDYEMDELATIIDQVGAKFVLIDTLGLFLRVKDLNDYTEVNDRMEQVRQVARKTKACLLLTHHTNKGSVGTASIMGSQAIFGSVDCSMRLEKMDGNRFLSSEQRGGWAFERAPLAYEQATMTYKIGSKADEF